MQDKKRPGWQVMLTKASYPENFEFLILGILELYTLKFCEMFVYKHIERIEYVEN